jgi:hypothetical protein
MGNNKRHVGTIAQLRPLLRESMEKLAPEAQDAVISLLQSSLERTDEMNSDPEYRGVNRALNETDVYYAIHTSDLSLLKEVASVAAACYALLQNPVAIIGGLVVFLYEYRRKRVRLTGEQGIVLKTLKSATIPGWSTEQVLSFLPFSPELTVPEVQLTLESLKSVIRMDGSETSLVREKDGLWLAVDV